ncbi:MAG TPA: TonB family protein [Bacteroidia bacterium]|jgi:protein TonB
MRTLLIIFLLMSATLSGQEKHGTVRVKKPGKITGSVDTAYIRTEQSSEWIIVPAQYKGGDAALKKFIAENIRVPGKVKNKKISGTCNTSFTVFPDGKIGSIAISQGVPGCGECDTEALRLIRLMGPWNPGTRNGKVAATSIRLPIEFR